MKRELIEAASAASAKSAPPLAVVGASLLGLSLQDWVLVLTVLYLLVQMSHFVWRWMHEAGARRK